MSDGLRAALERMPCRESKSAEAELEQKPTLPDDALKGARTIGEECEVCGCSTESGDSFGERGHAAPHCIAPPGAACDKLEILLGR